MTTENVHLRRLIEIDLPIKRISEHARPEKTTVHGNISTLHIWWARRPHAACRAVLCASLWPDPADPSCPESFVEAATECLKRFATEAIADKKLAATCSHDIWRKWQVLSQAKNLEVGTEAHANMLRFLLLDFIADFSKWENQAEPNYLKAAREITHAAHRAMGGVEATRPLVFDPFAGGGTIPLEAIRAGADAFASDLNPIAVLLNKVILEFVPGRDSRLTESLLYWASRIKEQVSAELKSLYPRDASGGQPLVYLYGRTVVCEGPGCGFTVPLIRTLDLGNGQQIAIIPDQATRTFQIAVQNSGQKPEAATVKGGSVSCPRRECGYTTPASSVRAQLKAKRGGSKDAQLLAVLVEHGRERKFRSAVRCDLVALERAKGVNSSRFPNAEINPIRPHKNTRGLSAVTRIGMTQFQDLYTDRQLKALGAFSKAIRSAITEAGADIEARRALTILGLCFGRLLHQNSTCSRWLNKRNTIAGSFGKQALQVTWDFTEIAPLSDAAGSWDSAIEWARKVIDLNRDTVGQGTVEQAPAQVCPLPSESADVLFTDPPYFAAIPYSDLANFFYVWERDFFLSLYPELFRPAMIDQTQEIVVTEANCGPNGSKKDDQFFREQMTIALSRARGIIRPNGIGIVVFADTRTSSWEALLGAVIESGWMITASWPIDTEHQNRTQAQDSASLQSSIHLICRPREGSSGEARGGDVGDWRDVLTELPRRMHDWMPRLQREGIVGADAIFACLGPALEIYSRYSKVEKASGERVALREYLEYVWAAVAKEALNMIFQEADATGFEEDARVTAMWLWTLTAGINGEKHTKDEEESDDDEEGSAKKPKVNGFVLEFDAARKIAQGLGAHLEQLDTLVEVSGDKARLLPVSERARHLFGKDYGSAPSKVRGKPKQLSLLDVLGTIEGEIPGKDDGMSSRVGGSVLDRIHRSMILFAAGRGEALKGFLVNDGVGADQRFWRLAQALSALYPKGTDERRWVEGVLARKKGLGL